MKKKPARCSYTREFKVEAVRQVVEQNRSMAEVARELGIGAGLLGRWKQQVLADREGAFPGKGRLKVADEELRRLLHVEALSCPMCSTPLQAVPMIVLAFLTDHAVVERIPGHIGLPHASPTMAPARSSPWQRSLVPLPPSPLSADLGVRARAVEEDASCDPPDRKLSVRASRRSVFTFRPRVAYMAATFGSATTT